MGQGGLETLSEGLAGRWALLAPPSPRVLLGRPLRPALVLWGRGSLFTLKCWFELGGRGQPLGFWNTLKFHICPFLCSVGKLRRVLHCCPEILTMRQRDIANTVSVLRDKCLFTVQQVTEILHRCPYVLREDPGELEYKFQVR